MLDQLPPYVVFRSIFQDLGGPYGCEFIHEMYRLSPSDSVYVAFRLEHINIWGRSR